MSQSEKPSNQTNVHEQKIQFSDYDLEPAHFNYPSNNTIPQEGMKLSGTINQIANFELTKVNVSNIKCFVRLFQKLASDAVVSNHQLIFSDEISDHLTFIDREQQEMLDFIHSLQENSVNSIHKQIIRITL